MEKFTDVHLYMSMKIYKNLNQNLKEDLRQLRASVTELPRNTWVIRRSSQKRSSSIFNKLQMFQGSFVMQMNNGLQ